jgi:sugar phosphate permease
MTSTTTRRSVVFFCFTCAYFLSYFFRSANAVIAGDLTRDLRLDAAALGLMTSLFYASFALVQLPIGVGLDRLGPRYVTPLMLLFSVAGALVFAAAGSFATAALGRALIGVGMASVLVGAMKIFGHWFPARHLATITGVLVGVGALGGLVAATPLAYLNAAVGWRAIFAGGAFVILAVALLIVVGTRNTPPGEPWQPARGPMLAGFGVVFRAPRFWRVVPLVFCLLGAPLAVQTLWGGPFARDVLGLSAIAAGNLLLAMGIGAVVGYVASGWLADRYGAQRVTELAAGALVLCQLPFVLLGARVAPALWVAAYAGFGFCGAFNVVLFAQLRGFFPLAMSGRASTALNCFAFTGAWLLQWWMGLIIDSFPRDSSGRYPPAAYATAFGMLVVLTALSLAWYLPLGRQNAPAQAGLSLED